MNIHHAILATSAILLLAPLMTGCGSTATISRVKAPVIEAQIVSSDESTLHVQTSSAGDTISIARNDVTDIDHPGNVAAVIGGIISAYGLVNLMVGAPKCERESVAYCAGVLLPATIGLPMMIYGITMWSASTSAAEKKKGRPNARISVLPVASLQKNNEFFGANLSATY
jgi:hypothetical protein